LPVHVRDKDTSTREDLHVLSATDGEGSLTACNGLGDGQGPRRHGERET